MLDQPPKTHRLLSAGNVALITAFVLVLTVVAVWLFGLGQHRTLFANSLISTTILFASFLVFITVGLYHGVKLRDDVGRLINRLTGLRWPSGFDNLDFATYEVPHVDGLLGFLSALAVGLLAAAAALVVVWLIGTVLWAGAIIFAAMLYWVFFRALRLIFKNSNRCRGQWADSLRQGIWYAGWYTVWVYAVIYAAHYLG